jgi:HSP20 family protein
MTLYISPYRRIANLRRAMDRMLEENYQDEAQSERDMLLAVDIKAEDDAYTLKALVPGMNAEDLHIEILNNTVTLRGEYKSEEKENQDYLVSELPVGRFSRVLTLPTALDSAKADAQIKNGVLILYIPKAEAHRPRSVKVSAG